MTRQIILDTESTGKNPKDGHKIVEFGAVEMIDRKLTGRTLQFYINPQRDIPDEVVKIHGITNEKVANCPNFEAVADEILEFIKGAELIIHNADFDVKFINAELAACSKGTLWDYVQKVTDTLFLSRSIDSSAGRHSLDAICDRYNVSRASREFHGALLDSQLLAEVYLKMTEGSTDLDVKGRVEQTNWSRPEIVRLNAPNLKVVAMTEQESLQNLKSQLLVAQKSKNKVLAASLETTIANLSAPSTAEIVQTTSNAVAPIKESQIAAPILAQDNSVKAIKKMVFKF